MARPRMAPDDPRRAAPSVAVGFRFPLALREAVEEIAEREGVTLPQVIRGVFQRAVDAGSFAPILAAPAE